MNKWMMFVDGENFTIRAQEIATQKGVELVPSEFFMPNVFVWPPLDMPFELTGGAIAPGLHPIRCYYYTTTVGDDEKFRGAEDALWKLGLSPVVNRKLKKQKKSKGVDISLTKDVLVHAFANHYDLAVIVTGDADFVPLVEEVKRMGKMIYVAFHEDAVVDRRLRVAADLYLPISFERFIPTFEDKDKRGVSPYYRKADSKKPSP